MLSKLTVRGRMYLILAMTLFMFIVNAQFAWMNLNKIKDIGLQRTETVLIEAHKIKIKVATDIMAASIAGYLDHEQNNRPENQFCGKNSRHRLLDRHRCLYR